MKTLWLFIVYLACSVCAAEGVKLVFDTGLGETVILWAWPTHVRFSKIGQPTTFSKNIGEGAYRQIHGTVKAFAKDSSISLKGIEVAESEFRNIRIWIYEADGVVYPVAVTKEIFENLFSEFKKHVGEQEVNRFINKYLVEPSTSGKADKLPA